MNLEEIGEFKEKIISKLIQNDEILEILIGDLKETEDIEYRLFGDEKGSGGCIYKFEYVPDVQENSKTFLCIEVVPEKTYGDTITDFILYVFAYCSKDIMQTYKRKKKSGTRIDILMSDIDKILNGNSEFGIGPLEWRGGDIYKPSNPYYGRVSIYSVGSFRRNRSS